MLEVNKIYMEDCLIGMQKIDDKSIDAIICDLPYGTTKCSWDIIIPFDKLWEQYYRIAKDNCPIVLFGQEPFSSLLRLSNLKDFKYDWYWQKERPTNVMQIKKRPGKTIETISVFYKNPCMYIPQKSIHTGPLRSNKIKNGKLGKIIDDKSKKPNQYVDDGTRYPTQLLSFKRDCLSSNLHPTQKPLDLIKYLVSTYTEENMLVLDNCMGSATTAIACIELKRNYIGFEMDKNYFSIGNKRILDTIKKREE